MRCICLAGTDPVVNLSLGIVGLAMLLVFVRSCAGRLCPIESWPWI